MCYGWIDGWILCIVTYIKTVVSICSCVRVHVNLWAMYMHVSDGSWS